MLKFFIGSILVSLSMNVIEAYECLAVVTMSKKPVEAFTAKYDLYRKSDKVGYSVRQLEYLDDGTARYSYLTKANWFIFSDKRNESSTIIINDDGIIPTQYLYQRKGTGKDKKFQWRYDISNNTATDILKNEHFDIEFPDNIQDKLSYHLQLRLSLINDPEKKQFTFPVISTSGSIGEYIYDYQQDEILKLPFGTVKTVKLKREVTERKRITYAWFAPELDFLLVKLTQYKDGEEQFNAELHSITKESQP